MSLNYLRYQKWVATKTFWPFKLVARPKFDLFLFFVRKLHAMFVLFFLFFGFLLFSFGFFSAVFQFLVFYDVPSENVVQFMQ